VGTGVILGLAIIFLVFFRSYARARGGWLYYYERQLRNQPLTKEQLAILQTYFKFYQSLPPASKKIFEKKVAWFIQIKKFIPRQLPAITTEMKVLISAAAVQLTFGLRHVHLKHFRYIIVYPDAYYSNITKKYHKGEVNPRHQAIVLSWKAFLEGYIGNEGVNLGLHEMAHALHLENVIRNQEYSFFTPEEMAEWDRLANQEIERIKNNQSHFFRLYGSTDSYEFFAVAVENFFERPALFVQEHPRLYHALAGLLHQNPLLLQS
jgi:Mlc titration factor MtfA (ptsG expression regulator)